MKRKLLILPLLLILTACTANNKETNSVQENELRDTNIKKTEKTNELSNRREDNDLIKEGLKGKVKSFTEISYTAKEQFGNIEKLRRERESPLIDSDFKNKYDEFGYLIEKEYYNRNGSLKSKTIYKYDNNRRKIESRFYDLYGNFRGNHLYRYSKAGVQTTEKSTRYDKKSNTIINTGISKYDDDGNEIERKFSFSGLYGEMVDSHYYYVYDEDGNKIEEKAFGREGKPLWKITYKYDEQRNLIESDIYNEGFLPSLKNTYKYDEYGNKIEEKRKKTYKYDEYGNKIEEKSFNKVGEIDEYFTYHYDKQGKMIESNGFPHSIYGYKTKYKYDEYGNLIQWQAVDNEDFHKTIGTIEYVYDEHGNWIKKIDFVYESPRYIIEREFEYY